MAEDSVSLPTSSCSLNLGAGLAYSVWVSHQATSFLCRRPGYRSTAEHILTLCKDKEYAVPFLAGQYQKSLIDHALHRLDSQVSMVGPALSVRLKRIGVCCRLTCQFHMHPSLHQCLYSERALPQGNSVKAQG